MAEVDLLVLVNQRKIEACYGIVQGDENSREEQPDELLDPLVLESSLNSLGSLGFPIGLLLLLLCEISPIKQLLFLLYAVIDDIGALSMTQIEFDGTNLIPFNSLYIEVGLSCFHLRELGHSGGLSSRT